MTFSLQTGWAEKWTITGIAGDFKPKQLRNGLLCLYLDKCQVEETASLDGFFVASRLEGPKKDEDRHRKRFQNKTVKTVAQRLVLPVCKRVANCGNTCFFFGMGL